MFGCQKFYFFYIFVWFFCLSLITHDVCKDVPISWNASNPRNIWILMKICYPFTSTLSHWGKLNFWSCIYIFLICRIGQLLHLLILNTPHMRIYKTFYSERPLMTTHVFGPFLTYLPTLSYFITSLFWGYFRPPYLP